MKPIKKVLIFGGTHGNEWTGIFVVKHFAEKIKSEFKNLDIQFLVSNPPAYAANRRFQDEDLNRAFRDLASEKNFSYEHQRARELRELIQSAPCFVLDLHTTTSNMGQTVIICQKNKLNLAVASRLKAMLPLSRIILSIDAEKKYLVTQSEFGMMIEVGPVPNSVLNGKILNETLEAIRSTLTALSEQIEPLSGEVEVYEETEDVYYPQNAEGELSAHINDTFEGKDFVPVYGEYAPFKSFSGEEITMKAIEELYPIFINEAAYYPKKLAYTLCRKRKIFY